LPKLNLAGVGSHGDRLDDRAADHLIGGNVVPPVGTEL
jgi:hypothetical protein